MELDIPGGTGPRWKSSLVHLLTWEKLLSQLAGSVEALPAEQMQSCV